MSDEQGARLEIDGHPISRTNHPHAYEALEEMNEVLREQVFYHARHSEHGGRFTAHVKGETKQYKLTKYGEIHEAHN
ncbi:MAG TPA: hypothetical protein VEA37_10045 [Flavobacterium sp.]|nr:hypothetical protein [Flavobacterium sp.]